MGNNQTNYLHLFLDESLQFLFPLSSVMADGGAEANKRQILMKVRPQYFDISHLTSLKTNRPNRPKETNAICQDNGNLMMSKMKGCVWVSATGIVGNYPFASYKPT